MKSIQLTLLTLVICSFTFPAQLAQSGQAATTRALIGSGQPETFRMPVYNFFAMKLLPGARSELQVADHIRCMLEDKNGAIWFGTNNDGVCRYDGKRFQTFTTYHGLAGNAVRNIAADKTGNIWLTTNAGVSRFDGKSFFNITEKDGLAGNDAWSLLCDDAGRVWIGTTKGISVYQNGRLTRFNLPQTLTKHTICRFTPKLAWSMYQDKDGSIWFGMDGDGVKKFDGKTVASLNTNNGLAGNNVLSITQDKDGNMWFGTWGNGLSRYNAKGFKNFSRRDGLAANDAWRLLTDTAGNLWIATLGGGISQYNGSVFTNYKETHGLTYNLVQSILQDKNGNMWFGLYGGVFRLQNTQLINFLRTVGDGC